MIRGSTAARRAAAWMLQYLLWLAVLAAVADRVIAYESNDPVIFRYVGF
jgi:hypothetical protein